VNLLKTKFRRTTAVLAGTVLGLAGVAVLAAPASAHSPRVGGSADCVNSDGSWTVSWKIGNDFGDPATVGTVSAKDSTGKAVTVTGDITGPSVVIPPYTEADSKGAIGASTKVTNSAADSVTLETILRWSDGYTNDGKSGRPPQYTTIDKPKQKCESTPTTPTTTPPTEATPSPTPTETPTLPVPTDAPNVFKPILEEDCTTMTIGADNPADGITWKFDLKTSKGEERSFTLKPGEKHTEKFSATEGFSIKVTISVTVDGKTYSDFDTVKYEKPGNCTGGEGGGGLAKTGAPTGTIAGAAVAVLALGAVLFFLARRRKVKFTA
jgi:LPXTG-motif cell wall-anchored protein